MFEVQWPLVLFSFLAGLGGFALASAALSGILGKGGDNPRFVTTVIAIACMVIGGCCSMMHLAVVENVMAAVTNILSFSGISIELVLLGTTCIVALIYAIMLKRDTSETARKVVAVLCIIAGVLLAFFCGHGYVMDGRPLWNTELLPLAYLGTAFGAGALLFATIQRAMGEPTEVICGLRVWILVGALLSLITVAAYVIYLGSQGALEGEAPTFAIVAIAGALAALGCAIVLVRPGVETSVGIAVVALVCAVAAGVGLRMLMWAASTGYLDLFEVAMTTRTWMF